MSGSVGKANLGIESQVLLTNTLLGALDAYTTGITLFTSHVTTIRLLVDYLAGGAGGAFEFIFQVSDNQLDWFDTTIDNTGAIVLVAAGSATTSDTHVHRFRSYVGKHPVDYAITLNKSTPFCRFNFAEYGNAAPSGTITSARVLMS